MLRSQSKEIQRAGSQNKINTSASLSVTLIVIVIGSWGCSQGLQSRQSRYGYSYSLSPCCPLSTQVHTWMWRWALNAWKSIRQTQAASNCSSWIYKAVVGYRAIFQFSTCHLIEFTMENAEPSFEHTLHRSIKRSIVAWKLVMEYKDHNLEAPPTLLQSAADTAVSKRTWERCICQARQELAQALALSAKAGAATRSSKNQSQWVSGPVAARLTGMTWLDLVIWWDGCLRSVIRSISLDSLIHGDLDPVQ